MHCCIDIFTFSQTNVMNIFKNSALKKSQNTGSQRIKKILKCGAIWLKKKSQKTTSLTLRTDKYFSREI